MIGEWRVAEPSILRAGGQEATLGGVIWVISSALDWTGWPTALLLLASLVIVPLGLGLVTRSDPHARECWFDRMRFRLLLPAALALVMAFALPPGFPAATLSMPWLAVTGLVAWYGINRLRRGRRSVADLCQDAG